MITLERHLAAWAYQNAWANHRLLAACAKLSPEEFAARRTSFFPSLKATLNHILTVDWLYVEALERAFAGREPTCIHGGAIGSWRALGMEVRMDVDQHALFI